MASEQDHLRQYKRNKKLLDEQCFDIVKSNFLDWVVTISFYSAVHLIEMELAKHGLNSRDHEASNATIAKMSVLKQIVQPYYTLYMESKKARYDCKTYSVGDIKKILVLLSKVEDVLLPVTQVSTT